MDSDTDQDEDEIQPSFSMTISERGSHCHVVRKVCSDSRKGSAGMSSSSGSVEESAVEGNEVFFVEDSTYGVGLSDSASLTNNEESSLRVITVCCRPQKPYKSSADDRTSCAEKAADDIFDSIPKVNENEGEIRDEDSTHMQDTPEQTSTLDDRDPELDVPEETPPISAAVPISLESPSQEVLLARHEEGEFEDISALESKSNEFSPFESRGGVSESPDSTKSRNTQNESDIHVDSYEAIEMLAQSIIFQSTCVVPVGSVQAVADPNLSEGMTLNDQESSSTGQLPGRKRKHSGKKTADAEGAVGGSSAENSVSSGDAEESFENKDSDKEAKKKKNRCAVCRKKVGLTGFECRCGGLFCAVHRYSDKHDCTFDYREMGAQEIRRNNPVVVGEKIQKI